MKDSFGNTYSSLYDQIYQDKDYQKETISITDIFRKSKKKVRTVLDMGCGTGNYSFPLQEKGFFVTGVDISEGMLKKAKAKIKVNSKINPVFMKGDVRSVRLKQKFDAVIMMFAVLGYQLENKDVESTLKTVRLHLDKGGIFLFDVWFGPGVLRSRPSERIKMIIPQKDEKIIRIASGDLDVMQNTCTVNYDLMFIKEEKVISETSEHHKMRYFFPRELEYFLEKTGFQLLRMGKFPQIDEAPVESEWNFFIEAEAI